MKIFKRIVKTLFFIWLALVIFVLAIIGFDHYQTRYLQIPQTAQTSYLITHVNVIPMNQDTVWKDQMVYIKEGIIQEIADTIAIAGVERIDGGHRYLMPGLIDMHVHVWDHYELGLYLSHGVTAVRNLWGMPMHLRMKETIQQEEIYAPFFLTTGPKLTGQTFIGDDNLNLQTPEEAVKQVIAIKDRGYDLIKTYDGLEKETFDALIEQAAKAKLDIVSHPSHKVPFSYHAHSQIKSIEHAEEIVQQPLAFDLDSLKLEAIIASLTATQPVNYCPTIVVFNNIYQMLLDDEILSESSMVYINPLIRRVDSPSQFDRWYQAKQQDVNVVNRIKAQHDFHLLIVRKLNEAGVTIIAGSDAGIGVTTPGYSLHQELAFYSEAGLSNYEVLQTATINAAQTHEQMHHLGSIAVGQSANLLLLDDNPLEDLSALKQPAMVFVNGRMLDRETLDQFDQKASDRNNLIVSAFRYLEYLLD